MTSLYSSINRIKLLFNRCGPLPLGGRPPPTINGGEQRKRHHADDGLFVWFLLLLFSLILLFTTINTNINLSSKMDWIMKKPSKIFILITSKSICFNSSSKMIHHLNMLALFLILLVSPSLQSSSAASSSSSSSSNAAKFGYAGQSSDTSGGDPVSDRWHTVSAYVGSELSMPCAVDVAGCGRIYFITWTKNVSSSSSDDKNSDQQHQQSSEEGVQTSTPTSSSSSSSSSMVKAGEWQRVFIHSDTFERVLGDLEQYGPKNRVRFGPKNLSTTNFAHLTLRTVVPEDDGLYKCDVTYVTPHAHGKCPSLTYIRVQTLVKPSSPTIRINGKSLQEYRHDHVEDDVEDGDDIDDQVDDDKSAKSGSQHGPSSDIDLLRHRQIGPFEEGSTIVFECSTFGGRPMPELRWFNGSRPLRSKIAVVNVVDGEEEGSSDLAGSATDIGHQSASSKTTIGEAMAVRRKVVATTRIIASRYDLGAKFECRVLWNNTDNGGNNRYSQQQQHNASLLNDWLLLDIKVRPLSIRVDSPRSPVVAGETVLLRCTVDGARPPANITWYNRSEVVHAEPLPSLTELIGHRPPQSKQSGPMLLSDKRESQLVSANQPPRTRITTELMTDGTYRSTSILAFVATRSDHQADFFCKGSNEILRNRNEVPLLQGVPLQVLYGPVVAIEPDGLIAVNESSTIKFWCTYDANPMNITEIRWFKDHRPLSLIDGADEHNSKIWSSKDERGTPTLTIRDIDRNDSAEYGCRVKNQFGASDSITTAKLQVAYPPVVTLEIIEPANQMIEERSNLALPQFTLRCSTLMGNPSQLLAVHWYRNSQHLLTTVSLRHLQAHQQQIDQPSNSVSTSTSPSTSLLHHSFYHRIGTGKHFTLVDESTPLAGPVNGQFLLSSNGTYGQAYVHYLDQPETLTIANVTRQLAGNYSCIGFNGAANASQLSKEKSIQIKYPPGPATLTLTSSMDGPVHDRFVLKGTQALLECRVDEPGDPPAHTIIWTHNGQRIERATTQFKAQTGSMVQTDGMSFSGGLEPLIARYRTPKADVSTSGEYRCRALNDLGDGEWGTYRLDVKSAPKLLQSLPATVGALQDQNLTLACRVECQPACQINWFHNNLTRLSPDIHSGMLVANEYRVKLRNGNELTFSVTNEQTDGLQGPAHTLSKLFIHNTSVLFDFDHFTCVSSNSDTEELGPPVYSTVTFRREYLPHSVHLSIPSIDLLEGEGYPEKWIQCSAFGNPPPRYYWTFEPFLVSTSDHHRPHGHHHHHPNQSMVVAIGSKLTLDKSMAQGRNILATFDQTSSTNPMMNYFNIQQIAQQQQPQSQLQQLSPTQATMGQGRFHATRTLSGNYTCMATNQHGASSATLSINVFYRPECELRRISTTKIVRQPLATVNTNTSPGEDEEPQQALPIMLSCTAISNPAPGKFSWFRRNGTELLEIHPSINSDHSLFVAISQDYDYASDSSVTSNVDYYHQGGQHHLLSNDYGIGNIHHHHQGGHTRQSMVMGVPPDANLDEYACVVANAIGESRPCWFQQSPLSDGHMLATANGHDSSSTSTREDNLFMVAVSAGVIVFCLVIFVAVAIVFCMHRNRSAASFKGLIGRNSNGRTPSSQHHFKLDRPHLLLDHRQQQSSSPVEQLVDVDFIMDHNRLSKTATLTAGYRMTTTPNHHHHQQLTPLITGTLSKNDSYRLQNPYSTAGSIYGPLDDGPVDHHPMLSASSKYFPSATASTAALSSHPYPPSIDGASNSTNGPVYAEPEYHCVDGSGGSNPSADGQLTGSTNVTIGSSSNNTSQLQLTQPPLPLTPSGGDNSKLCNGRYLKYNNKLQGTTNIGDEDENLNMVLDDPLNDNNNGANYEEVQPIARKKKSNQKKNKNQNKKKQNKMQSISDNNFSSSSDDDIEDGGHVNDDSNDSQIESDEAVNEDDDDDDDLSSNMKKQCLESKPKPKNKSRNKNKLKSMVTNYEPYEDCNLHENLENDDDDDDSSSAPSTAYKPERDFFVINRQQQPGFMYRNNCPLSSNSGNGSSSRRRLLPNATNNKYGSLIRHQQDLSSSPGRQLQHITTGTAAPHQYHQSPLSTRLYYNFDNSTPSGVGNNSPFSNNSLARYHPNGWRTSGASGLVRQQSDSATEGIKTSTIGSGSHQPPDYHQTLLDRFYNEQQQSRVDERHPLDSLYR